MNRKILLKQLVIATALLLTGLIATSQIYTQGFEGGNFPPTGWSVLHDAGGDVDALWESATTGADGGDDGSFNSFEVDPHTGTGMAQFRSYDFSAGNSSLLISSMFSLVTPGAKTVSFWMHRDDGYANAEDIISLYINTSASATGATLIATIQRNTQGNPVATAGIGWYKYTFTIPAAFNTASNYLIFNAMSDWGNNMFIDDISVDEFAACTGTPSAGTISGPGSACQNTQIVLESTGTTDADGMAYAWQSASNINGPWTNIPGQTGFANATVSQTTPTYYRLYVTCTNSSTSDSSNTLFITVTPSNQCYCKPPDVSLHSFVDDYITNVQIISTTLNSSNGTDIDNGYTQVMPTPVANTAELSQLTSYNIVASIVDGGPVQVSCWFDFNNNGVFEAGEFTDLNINGATATGNITVPSDAVVGQIGLRFRARGGNFTDPCEQFASGETEDYVVSILVNNALNASLVDIIPPATGCNSGNTVTVKMRNSGNVDIAAGAATVGLYITGANPQTLPTQTNPTLLAQGDTATFTFTGNFSLNGTNIDSAAIVSLSGDAIASDNSIVTSHITLPAAVTAPYAEDFESAPAGWTVSQLAGTGNWVLSDTVYYYDYQPEYLLLPKSGNTCALFDCYDYSSGTASRLSSNCITIPANANDNCGYIAGFYFTQDAQYFGTFDSISVKISADGGNSFTRLGVVTRVDSTLAPTPSQAVTSTPQWKLYTFDVGAYAGQTVQFAFDAFSRFGNQIAIDSFFVGPKTVAGNVALSGGTENGAILSADLTACTDADGWTYYTDDNSARYLIGVQWDPSNTGANAAAKAQATAKISVDRKWFSAENTALKMATYTMQRYWDVNLNGAAMTGPANLRFFYSQREFDSILVAKANFIAANPGATDEGFWWFKTISGQFIPSPASVTYDSVLNSMQLQNVNFSNATINGVLYAQFNNITSFSGGTAASGVGPVVVVPVGLLSFSAQRNARTNKLSWATSQEINTAKFIVEHSKDGRNYIAIGDVIATGNNAEVANYAFIHHTPVLGTNFYRLRIVEKSGNIKLSPTKSVRNEGTADIAIYPNPVKDWMMVNITSDKIDRAIITLSDMNGKLVLTKNNTLSEGSNYININTHGLSAGTYIVKIQLNDDIVIKKVNKLQ